MKFVIIKKCPKLLRIYCTTTTTTTITTISTTPNTALCATEYRWD